VTDVVTQSWRARGGRTWLGQIVPGCLGAIALLALAGAVYSVTQGGRAGRMAPFLFLLIVASLAGWLVWKVARTVWMVSRTTENDLVCWASGRQWSLGPGEVRAVKGDAYGLFLVFITASEKKIWLWAQMEDRAGLLAAGRRSSPSVEIDRYAEPRQRSG
jgi:uncharacterized membrane protein YeaQ/YmgE (transglycosylase-associated protein family)